MTRTSTVSNRQQPNTPSLATHLAVGLALGFFAPAPVVVGVLLVLAAIDTFPDLRARFQARQDAPGELADRDSNSFHGERV